MISLRSFATAAAMVTLAAASAHAQTGSPVPPIAVEGHIGVATPSSDFKNDAKQGAEYGLALRYTPLPFLGFYAGYDERDFSLKDGLVSAFAPSGSTGRVRDSGVRLGAQIAVPTLVFPIQPFVEGGILLNSAKYEFTNSGVTEIVTSNANLGYEFGGGLNVRVMPHFSLVPEVRYRTSKPSYTFEDQGRAPEDRISSLSFDLGVRFKP